MLVTFVKYSFYYFFFFNDTATTEIYTLSLHDARSDLVLNGVDVPIGVIANVSGVPLKIGVAFNRSEEHTSELQSLTNLVCRLLLEKKKTTNIKQNQTQTKQEQFQAPRSMYTSETYNYI